MTQQRNHRASHPATLSLAALGIVGVLAGCTTPEASVESDSANAASETAAASQDASSPDGEMPSVVAVTALLCDIAEEVAGESIDLTCLMAPGQDPHSYRLKPSDLATIETADLVLYNGYNLMPGLAETIEESAAGQDEPSQTIAVAELAVPEPMLFGDGGHDHGEQGEAKGEHDEHGHDEHGHNEHDHGEHDHDEEKEAHDRDEHAGHAHEPDEPDPHVWHSAQNGAALVSVVADSLAELAPDRAEEYQANADALEAQLTSLHDWIGEQFATVPEANRQLVTTHDAFNYYTAAYGLTQASALSGLSPLDRPTPAELAAIADRVKASGVPAIFSEVTSSAQLVESVAREAGVKLAERSLLVDSPDAEVEGAESYPAMLAYNTCTIVDALGGSCDREALGF